MLDESFAHGESGELPCAGAITFLCGSSQAGQRIDRTRVEFAAHEKARDRAAPSRWKAETTVVIDAALILSDWDAAQIFTHRYAKGELRTRTRREIPLWHNGT